MMSEDQMHATELDQYWDALVLARRLPRTERLDDETADLIDRLWSLGDPPALGLARDRVRRRLQRHPGWEERDMDAGVHAASDPHFARSPRTGASSPLPSGSSGQAGWRSVLGLMATAALLMLALAGSFLTFGIGRPGHESLAPVSIPAMGPPETGVGTGEVAMTELLDLVIPTFADDTAWVQLDRYTFPAATTLEADMQGGSVPEVFFVVDGELAVRVFEAPQPVRVIRSGNTEPEEALASGDSVTLAAGDALVIPENAAANLMNMAAEPAIALLILLPSNVALPLNTEIRYESPVGSIRNLSAPLRLGLEQATLDPGASLPGMNATNVERAVVPLDPSRVMDARIGSNGSLLNAGDEPLDAYVLTVTSDAALP